MDDIRSQMKSSRPVHPTLHALCVQCKRRERFIGVVVSCGFGLFNVMALYNAKEKERESIYIYMYFSLSLAVCV